MSRTLTVYLAADLKKFSGGMKDAERQAQGFGGTLNKVLGPALIGAGVAAGAFAVKLGVDGVKAAMDDQVAVASLATTLGNLNLAHDTSAVEEYIYELERAYGVADTDLRPAYERLVRSTKDTEEANKALKIAMDISASTGKSLQTVVDTLGRAYDGSTTSLSRLGVGLDQAQLSAMSLDEIMTTLAMNFAGQADANAKTLEGQFKRLTTATDNLKEAFGAGLLQALGDTDETTQDLVEAMEDLEPIIKSIGEEAGNSAQGVADLLAQLADLAPEADTAGDRVADLGAEFSSTFGFGAILDAPGALADIIDTTRVLVDENYKLEKQLGRNQAVIDAHLDYLDAFARQALITAGAQRDLNAAIADEGTEEVIDYRYAVEGAQGALARMYAPLTQVNDEVDENRRVSGGAAKAVDKLTDAQEQLLKNSEKVSGRLSDTTDDIIDQIGALERAEQAIKGYADSMQANLLGGIDLGALYEGQFDEDGNRVGVSWVEGFNQAVDQAEWFGNVLNALKSRQVDQRLIEQIASLGPATGGALGQELLDGDGALLDTLNTKWIEVQDTTRDLALGLVPEYMEAGRQSAIENLNSLAEQFKKDQNKLKKLGKNIGKQVGASFKQQIAKDVAEAVRAVEAAATAARAEKVAEAKAEQARITEQSVAQALSGLISQSDARLGRNVEPVLG